MGEGIQKLFSTVSNLQRKATVNAAFGKPVTTEGRTIIPVAEVAYGFRLGFRASDTPDEQPEEAESGGGGGASRTRPLGVIEVTQEGVRVEPVVDEQKIALATGALIGWIALCIARTLVRIFGE
jgi:uncharacterized spore protein YtfJ